MEDIIRIPYYMKIVYYTDFSYRILSVPHSLLSCICILTDDSKDDGEKDDDRLDGLDIDGVSEKRP